MANSALFTIPHFISGTIEKRLNRFVVQVKIRSQKAFAHINNTGRLLEILRPGARAFCIPSRWKRARYRLFAVGPRNRAVLIDTRLQMSAFEQALKLGLLPWLKNAFIHQRSPHLLGSTFDYLICDTHKILVEVKSATLKSNDYAFYPDCPSARARRQISDMIRTPYSRKIIVFIATVPEVCAFRPNKNADPELYFFLREAKKRGIELRCIHVVFSPPRILLLNPDLPVLL